MNITKREKILLQILLGVLVVGIMFVYLLLPKMKEHKTLLATKEEDENTLIEMNEALANMDVFDEKKEALERIDKINLFFNGIWNSYTMDGFVNKLVDGNHLEIKNLSIGTFHTITDAAYDIVVENGEYDEESSEEYAEQVEEEDLLLVCDVSLAAYGTYENVLSFMESLNKESKTIEIVGANISKDFFRNFGEADEKNAEMYADLSMTFRIYGIVPFVAGGNTIDEQ